jgi:hypothetical protein
LIIFLGKELILDLIESPEELTYVGILDRFDWITKHNSKLSIPQDDDIDNDIKQIEKVIKRYTSMMIQGFQIFKKVQKK